MKNTKININIKDNSHTTKSRQKGRGKPTGTLIICAYCNGRGKDIIGMICPTCHGKGKVRV